MSDAAFVDLIAAKRDGQAHTRAEMDHIILGYARGEVPDYQMSAWIMAAYLKGLDHDETVWMTDAMVRSGEVVDLSPIPGVKVDKHSTGGVADTTTLVLAPLVAACGVPVAKMSGRGLGHTGGTLDKLEAIPGMCIELSSHEFVEQVRRVGIAVVSQSPDIDPADKRMYALRDVTATVPSIPMIVGSIISKKVAGGADAVVLDVKVGSGAFMKTEAEARELAAELTRVGRALGREVECLMTDMDQPLGMAVGNSLEVIEAIETLKGEGPHALTELSLVFGEHMLILGQVARDQGEARAILENAIDTGAALETFKRWVQAQGGDPAVADDTSLLPVSTVRREVCAVRGGHVVGFDAEGVGHSAMLMGAGRATTDDSIDPGAGVVLDVRIGSKVQPGDRLATAYAASEALLDEAEPQLLDSIRIGNEPTSPPPLFHRL
jgi:pyrimidine-nucleoside phosphorylase